MKKVSIILMVAIMSTQLSAQELTEVQYGAYLKTSYSLWERAISLAEKKHGAESFEKAMAGYGLLNVTMAFEDEDKFDEYVEEVSDLLKEIIEEKPDWGEPKAVLSSVYGLRMAYDPWKGIIYGAKSGSLMNEAYNQQPESALVQKLYAGSKLYTPEMFGGDVGESKKAYLKSIEIYEKSNDTKNWLYLDALVGLSMAQKKLDEPNEAKKSLEKALEIEPAFGWAKGLLAELN